jgi:Tfp pilus assembly protein PilF
VAHGLQEEGQLAAARELLDVRLDRGPDEPELLMERGRLALRLGEREDAERWLRRAVEAGPEDAEANVLLARVLEAAGKRDEALDRKVEEHGRRQAEFRLRLHEAGRDAALLAEFGRFVMVTGDVEEAAGWLYAAIQEDPRQVAAHQALAELFARLEQPRRAAKHARLAGIEPPSAKSRKVKPRAATVVFVMPALADVKEAAEGDVQRLCAACHAYPPPETMPRMAWRKEVKQGYELLRASTLTGDFPALSDVLLHYERRASERLPPIEQAPAAGSPPVKFEKRGTGWMVQLPPYPGVANVNLSRLFGGEKLDLLLCDTRLDRVLIVKPYEKVLGGQALPQVIAPSHTLVADLDGDGRQDVLVASLGNFFPTDDLVGKVVWLRGGSDGSFTATTLLEGVGRVSDVQAADLNGDGRLDLAVAVFGWRTTGEILWLENRTTDWSRPEFVRHRVEGRHGAIHVPPVDLNGDGRMDLVGLLSQEHESVVGYLNDGRGAFTAESIFVGPHPTYGASGIEVVDLDGDDDLDVLMTNGDVLDRPYLLKPYHGVQWLENKGTFPFEHHALTPMYGASRAVAADFDGDGDRDVVAVSFLPRLECPERESLGLPSVVLLEQTARRQFALRVLERGACDHFTCAAGDWDGDGRVDLAVGNFSWKRSQAFGHAAMLWQNVGGR